MTDTWGIPGTTFLWAFIAVAAVAAIWAYMRRAAIVRGADQAAGAGRDHLSPAHVAYLAEGPQRAIYSSMALLRKAHAIDVDEQTGRFDRTGPLPAGATSLDAAVLHAASQRLRHTLIRSDPSVQRALGEIRQDLERRGLLISDEQRRAARNGGRVLLLLLGVGIARLVSGLVNDKPVGYLSLTLLALAALTIPALIPPSPRTSAGRKRLAELRRSHHYLDRSHQPAWQTYDPAMTALGVGLFGAAVLLYADPVLAAQTHVPAGSSGSYGGGFDGGGSSGSSCGGGGSSCGGGGGCGGGCGG